MREFSIEVSGLTLAAAQSAGTGTPVLFVHGNSSSHRTFAPLLEGPLGARHRSIAVTLPGHGRSSRAAPEAPDAYTLPFHAGVLREVVERLELRDVVYAGHSMGGHVLIEGWPMPGARGLAIWGTPPFARPPNFEQAFLPTPLMGVIFKGELTREESQAWAKTASASGDPPAYVSEDVGLSDPLHRVRLAESAATLRYRDEVEIVRELGAPLAVLHGHHDPFVSEPYLRSLALPTLWRSSVQVIEGSGHWPQNDQPAELAELLGAFCRDVEPGK